MKDRNGHAGQSFQSLGLKCPFKQQTFPTICKPLQNSGKCLQSSVTVETCFLSEIREKRPQTRSDQMCVSLSLTFSTCLYSSQVTVILPLIKDSAVPLPRINHTRDALHLALVHLCANVKNETKDVVLFLRRNLSTYMVLQYDAESSPVSGCSRYSSPSSTLMLSSTLKWQSNASMIPLA